jgi:hypothetical protein
MRRTDSLLEAWMCPVTVPDSFNEFQALGFTTHKPLQPLIPVAWTGVPRRAHEAPPEDERRIADRRN